MALKPVGIVSSAHAGRFTFPVRLSFGVRPLMSQDSKVLAIAGGYTRNTEYRRSLKITGPHAGKARDESYSGTATITVDLAREAKTKLEERIK